MNNLYYGDNLPILRSLPSNSIDLIYLDPPFNSSRNYNVLFKDQSNASSDVQITAFGDTWSWGPSAEAALTDIIQANPAVQMPPETGTFLAAQKVSKSQGRQNTFGI